MALAKDAGLTDAFARQIILRHMLVESEDRFLPQGHKEVVPQLVCSGSRKNNLG